MANLAENLIVFLPPALGAGLGIDACGSWIGVAQRVLSKCYFVLSPHIRAFFKTT